MKKFKLIVKMNFCLVAMFILLSYIALSYATIIDADNGKMKYYRKRNCYDIQGYVNGKIQSTTFNNGGYHAKLKVDNNNEEELYDYSYGEMIINGVKWDVECTFINNGKYVKTTYTLTNTESTAKKISLGVYADVQIAENDRATIERFDNNKGLRLYDTESNIQFSFYGKSVAGTTNIDNLWIGEYPKQRDNYFNNNTTQKIEGKDSAFAFSWIDRTLAPGVTNRYSTIIGMGEVSNAPTIALDENQGNCFSQDNVIIKGTMSDADKNSKVSLNYILDDGEEKKLDEQALVDNKVDFALNLNSQKLSIGKHKIKLWAIDESGNPSEITEKEILITNLKAPTLNMNEEWTKEPVKFKITDTVNDKKDVQKYQYKINNGQWKDLELGTETTALENTGTAVVTVRAVGKNADEYSSSISKTAKIDKDKPAIAVTEKDSKVKIEAKDQHSGIKNTKYVFTNQKELSGKEEFIEYKNEIEYNNKQNEDKDLFLHIISIDKVGNEATLVKEYKKPVAATIETEQSFNNKKPTYKLKDDVNQPSGYKFQVKVNDSDWKNVELNTEYTIDNPIKGNNTIKTRTIDLLGRISTEKNTTTKYIEEKKDDTVSPGILPQTGMNTTIIIAIIILVTIAFATYFINKKYRDIK